MRHWHLQITSQQFTAVKAGACSTQLEWINTRGSCRGSLPSRHWERKENKEFQILTNTETHHTHRHMHRQTHHTQTHTHTKHTETHRTHRDTSTVKFKQTGIQAVPKGTIKPFTDKCMVQTQQGLVNCKTWSLLLFMAVQNTGTAGLLQYFTLAFFKDLLNITFFG